GRADAGDDRFLRALLQTFAAALHCAEELVEVDLERREDPVRPVLHLEPRLACLAPRVVDDVLRLLLGELDDLRLRRLTHRPLADRSSTRRATGSGTNSVTFPPKAATSFTPLEETKETAGLAIT